MGLANIIGLVLGWGLIVTSIALGGFDKLPVFWDTPSICIVFGGAFSAIFGMILAN
ncbi:hypothetical protein FACS189443_6790 [Planctomycetales bacterium]|nr:hypothetical protein FACS189443_6790 [Planctomycetales bacterium]